QHAEQNIPYYWRMFQEVGFRSSDLRTINDFRSLPVLTKSRVAEHLAEFVSRQSAVHAIACTSGTTSSLRLPRFLCEEELEACALLHGSHAPPESAPPRRDILLRILPSMRRYVAPGMGGGCPQIVVALSLHYPKFTLKASFDDFVLKQFFERFPVPGT